MPAVTTKKAIRHLYVHVPFCATKCHYCAFSSAAARPGQMARYVANVGAELQAFRDGAGPATGALRPTTIFFGGGTPSLLPVGLLDELLGTIAAVAPPDLQEWTVECNPATVSAAKAAVLRARGVNRLSLGIQSFDPEVLTLLGRIHTADQARGTYHLLREAGFDNINLDLMFALPGQTVDQWRQTLEQAVALEPDHLAAYCLTFEEDTAFWALWQQGTLRPNEDREREMFELTIDTLAAAGYHQYEISNFARPGRECRHNLAYWEGRDYLGLGPSACSTVGTYRWQNLPDTDGYAAALAAGRWPLATTEELSATIRAGERAAFGLRMTSGVPATWATRRWGTETKQLLADGLLEKAGDRLRLTRRGLLFADEVATAFV